MKKLLIAIAATMAAASFVNAQTYFEEDFESDTVGEQPGAGFTFSPSSNSATNGAVVVDGTSTPPNPLSGQSLRIYDASGGDPTHMRTPFNGGTNVSNLRVDFDFQSDLAIDETDTDTRLHFAVARAGDSLNNSDFRPFEIRIQNNGTLVVNSIAGSETAADQATDAVHHLTLLINSHDTESVDYDDATLGSGTVLPNNLHVFLDGTSLGAFVFHQTPDPSNAPQIDFYAEDNDLGQFAFYQDTSRQGEVTVDNIVIQSLVVTPPNELINISTRGLVGTGDDILIGGIVISGEGSQEVLIRASGQTLGELGVEGVLADTVLTLFDGDGTEIATNTNWGDAANSADIATAATAVGAFPFTAGSTDSAILMTLDAGRYTAQVSGNGGTTGVAIVEVYKVD